MDDPIISFSDSTRIKNVGHLRALLNDIPDSVEVEDSENHAIESTLVFVNGSLEAVMLTPIPVDDEEE